MAVLETAAAGLVVLLRRGGVVVLAAGALGVIGLDIPYYSTCKLSLFSQAKHYADYENDENGCMRQS